MCNLEYELTPFLCCCQPAAPAESFWKDVAPLDDVLQVFCPFPCRPAARSLGCFHAALFPPSFMHLEGNLSHFYFVKLHPVFLVSYTCPLASRTTCQHEGFFQWRKSGCQAPPCPSSWFAEEGTTWLWLTTSSPSCIPPHWASG